MLSLLPVLIISSDAVFRNRMADMADKVGLQPVLCPTLDDACTMISRQDYPLVFCGDDLPDADIRTSLNILTATAKSTPVIVLSRHAEWDAYLSALNAGAFDFIAFPPSVKETERLVSLALKRSPVSGKSSLVAA